jgi:GNAT superfamily N-acetyltransferase
MEPASRQGEARPEAMTDIRPVRTDAEVAEASRLVRAFFAHMRARFPDREALIAEYLIQQNVEGQLADFRAHFNPPRGECMLARIDGLGAGIVMLKPFSEGVCELNRMYVAEVGRGRALGRKLCEALMEEARGLGYREMRLDCFSDNLVPLRLYRGLGFGPDPDPPAFSLSDPSITPMRMRL